MSEIPDDVFDEMGRGPHEHDWTYVSISHSIAGEGAFWQCRDCGAVEDE